MSFDLTTGGMKFAEALRLMEWNLKLNLLVGPSRVFTMKHERSCFDCSLKEQLR